MVEKYPIPVNEKERLDALRTYQILDSAPEQEYDAITRLASYICQVPMAMITLIDHNRQWLKSTVGIDITETPRADAFCRYTILNNYSLEVPDTLADERFSDNKYVKGEPGIRFYAGSPLIDEDGYRLGSLCVADYVPRKLTREQLDALQILSDEVISHLTLRRQKAELEATVSRQQEFYNLFNSSPDIHCITNEYAGIELVNHSFTQITGHSNAEAEGKPIWSFFCDDDKDHIIKEFKQKIKEKKPFEIQTRIATGGGNFKWVNWSGSNKAAKWYISGRDNTQQKKIRAELEQLSLVANNMVNGVVITNIANEIIWTNPAFTKITGFNQHDVQSMHLSKVLKGDYQDPAILAKTNRLIKTKKAFEIDLQINKKDGTLLWISIVNSVVLDKKGKVEKYIKIIIDITDRKKAENDLNILSFAARKSPSGIIIRDRLANVVWMNEAFEKITGYSLNEMKNQTFGTLLLGADSDLSVFDKAKNLAKKNKPYEVEIKIYKKDKTPIWVFLSNSPMFNEAGDVERQIGVMVDITERKAAEMQLTMLSLVASNTVSGVVINDDKGEVEWINSAFTKITGYDIKNVRGRHLGDVLKGELTDISIIEKTRELSKNKESFEVDLLVYRKDGQPLWITIINSVILNSAGKVDKYVEVLIDITSKKKAELELIAAKEEALQLSRAKEMFISVMSHEIRTPLNAVIGITHLLQEDDPLPSQKENLNVLKFSAENLMMLINDVLDFTKIETGNVQLEQVTVDLRELLQSIVATMQFKADSKSIYIRHHIDEAVPDTIIGDSTRLVQILLNLIGNAIKFTSKGGVVIDLKVIEQTNVDARIRFAVTDTGIGIEQEQMNSIFELWKQAATDTTRKYGGTGLGLAISKRLVNLHDSRINVDSVPGHGSTFWFTITFKKAIDSLVNKKNKVEEGLKLHALVVDDNQINRLLINKVLKKWGATADFAENGVEAVQKIKVNKNYDLVLMDIHMPEMDGLEATKIVRGLPESYFQQLPVIALTASMMDSQMSQIAGAGMNDYILKPFDPKALFEKLSKYQKQ